MSLYIVIQCDATSLGEVEREFGKITNVYGISKIDVLVECIGDLLERRPFVKMTWELLQKAIDINLKSAFLFTVNALPIMTEEDYSYVAVVLY